MNDLLPYLTPKVKQNIKEAFDSGRLHFIEKNGNTIGFHTWEIKDNKIVIYNLWIDKKYRDKNNLLFLRDYFRKKYPLFKFIWRNRKKGKLVEYD